MQVQFLKFVARLLEKIDDIDALNEYRKAKKKNEKFIPIEKVIQDLGLD